ncbi:retropepsin-like domain-containing protein [Iningainema tapete]|uniref:Retropepsin-like domain-containing protein n=1 Tax=Iningainema tapete BLCC-T55 TaxID=2748662 RepID=A0A8J6XUZ8_9CYAN|nr:retropepsin-like domain-containing protein [Iningainema tapete]MBD2776587.1 retropepsin-like domain-containing protein [Iningainema tapete BLCC-T55]
MSKTFSQDESQQMLKWLNRNREQLKQYAHQYIAYNANGIIAHGQDLRQVLELAQASGELFTIYLVPGFTGSIIILPIRLRSVSRHEWLPNYQVNLKHKEFVFNTTILVDSGADFSLISHKVGQDLGYALADGEQTLLAQTIGGSVEYVLRNVEMTIDGHSFMAPVAWLQNNTTDVMLLGREVVFDKFNIEFKQADEQIIFTWREESE